MQYTVLGEMIFDDPYELVYELLNELEYTLKHDGSIYDPFTNSILSFNGMIIKASTNPNNIHYAGQGEIEFDILSNVRLVTTLFGHYLQKKEAEGLKLVSTFTEETESTAIEGAKLSRLTVRTDINHDVSSPYYYNKCLKFIWMIFAMEGTCVNFRNFEPPEAIL